MGEKTIKNLLAESINMDEENFNIQDILLNATIADVQNFDLLDFANNSYDPFCDYMQMFYSICDNAIFLNMTLGIHFNFE